MGSVRGPALHFAAWTGSEKIGKNSNGLMTVSHRRKKENNSVLRMIDLSDLQWRNESTWQMRRDLVISYSCRNAKAPALESGNFNACFCGNWLLKKKAEEVAAFLNGRCIFLVGMMGCGKSTVGKILSEVLGYSFVDSDRYVEQSLGGTPVAQIFEQCGENFFREYESEALRKLSTIPQQVVATGGGAVVRSINWKYMRQGITVFLDVPLDALARRIAAVGTDSRPLLSFEPGDPYTMAFRGLFILSKKRAEAYANADATVSLQHMMANLGLEDISDVTPTAIAMEVLEQIENLQERSNGMSARMFP
ncbi:shikimate kinase, chloroplastic-like [Malania oleifera]|uniref:shikimate kinase, chloroplastic-like n=1 Tax=Malania oleifera TaxID=397392 RepID=UPI0025AE543E|nr:shikimate kinase, chloroplastic-like [Malania oleifera]